VEGRASVVAAPCSRVQTGGKMGDKINILNEKIN
jgi:hypothetical protein